MAYTLITGACGGLGGAFVEALAKQSTPLFLTGRSEERLIALKARLFKDYPDSPVEFFPCDLSDEQSREELFRVIEEKEIQLNRLIYVAGADVQKRFTKYTQSKLTMQARVNFEGAVSLSHFFFTHCEEDGKAEFLAIGSISGLYPMPYFALYSASKRALQQFCAALRVEQKGRGKVTCVLPGAIPTREDIRENIKTQGLWGKLAVKSPQSVAKASLKAVSRNRRTVVIGFWNRLMHVFTACVPLSLKIKFIAKRWSKTEKDAF